MTLPYSEPPELLPLFIYKNSSSLYLVTPGIPPDPISQSFYRRLLGGEVHEYGKMSREKITQFRREHTGHVVPSSLSDTEDSESVFFVKSKTES